MINLPHNLCYGCSGCLNICPKDAITMKEDEFGYRFPTIDLDKCIDCSLCEKVCPELNTYELSEPKSVLAAVCKDTYDHKTSASGGFATVLSRYIIEQGGVVYGCSEKNYKNIRHIRVDRIEDVDLLKRSKYVHSSIEHTYREALSDLKNGRQVLFVGTPCQISGLKGFLRKSYENLITVDVVCHGVPNMRMLAYDVENNPNFKGVDPDKVFVDFRWKSRYGIRYGIRFGIDGEVVSECVQPYDAYMYAFNQGISYRENCHRCPYAKKERIGDITVADFWGIKEIEDSKFKNSTGVSLLLINTKKGQEIFKQVADRFETELRTFEEAARRNANLSHPSNRPSNKDEFLQLWNRVGLHEALIKCDPSYKRAQNPIVKFCSTPFIKKLVTIIRKTPLLNQVVTKIYRILTHYNG